MSPNEATSPADQPESFGELTENLVPGSDDGYITEDVVPEAEEVFRSPTIPEPTHTDKTRRTLALGILGALILVYLGIFVCFLLTNMPMESSLRPSQEYLVFKRLPQRRSVFTTVEGNITTIENPKPPSSHAYYDQCLINGRCIRC